MFNLYFAGCSQPEVMNYGKDIGICKLFTQLTERTEIAKWLKDKEDGKMNCKIFIDSGAYSEHTDLTGKITLDMDEYIEFLNARTHLLNGFAEVDAIPGKFRQPKTKEEIEIAAGQSWENYLYMRERVKEPDKLVPILHQGEHMKWLRNMLEWTDKDGKHIPYIGLSSSKDRGTNYREAWYWEVFSIIQKSSNPNVKTHAFGTSSISHLERFPFYSADATSWVRVGSYGQIYTKYGLQTVSDQKERTRDHITADKVSMDELRKYVASFGFNLEELIWDKVDGETSAIYKRQMFNLAYLHDWAKNYKYKGPKSFVKRSLLKSRR